MRLRFALILSLTALCGLTLVLQGSAVTAAHTQLAASHALDSSGSAPPLRAFNFPSCFTMHGSYCPSPGACGRCQYTPYEPELCACQGNNTWKCMY